MRIGTARCNEIRRVCALMAALALVFVCNLGDLPGLAEADGMLRVMLTRLGAPTMLMLTVDCDYYLASDPAVRIESGETATVTADGNGMILECGEQRVELGETAKLMRSQSGNRGVKFVQPELSNRFCGDLGLSASGGVITAILNIYIENYLYGVVGYAMPPSAGLEALKAMAVAARTAALRRKGTRSDAAYDLTDTGDLVFKGYNGTQDYAGVVRAVDETRGGVLYYGGSLARVACCASNGGQTESSRNAGGPALDYTVVRDDPYDLESKTAAVKTAVVNKDLTGVNAALYAALTEGVRDQLEARGVDASEERFRLVSVESVTACDSRFPAPSRLYKSLTFKLNVAGTGDDGAERTGVVSVSIPTYGTFESWYDLSLNAEDNETVWVSESERAFNIFFRRSGSGVGLSQRGAQVMAEKDMRAADILSFYFPGVEGRTLSLADTTRDNRGAAIAAEQRAIATARLTDKTDLLDAPDADAASNATVAAGAVVEVYDAQGEWAAVGSSGKYGYMHVDGLESVSLAGGTVVRAEGDAYGRAVDAAGLLALPDSDAEALGTIPAGTTVRVLAWSDSWRQVEWSGIIGFAAAEIIEPGEARATAEPEDVDPDAFVDAGGDVKARLKQDAPLFETPNALSSTLETLKAGDQVTVLAYSREWARVRTHSGKVGCLRLESITAMEEENGTSRIEGGAVQRVKGKKFMFVTTGSAPVYASWSTESEVIGTLYYGEKVRVGAYNSLWACVRVDSGIGYMRMDALSNAQPAAIEGGAITRANPGMMAVAREELPVYDAVGGRQIMTLAQGDRVSVDAWNAAWALVRVDGVTGYARLQSLERAAN